MCGDEEVTTFKKLKEMHSVAHTTIPRVAISVTHNVSIEAPISALDTLASITYSTPSFSS